MLLAFAVNEPFTPLAMNPALVPSKFFQFGRVFVLELGVGVRRLVQDATERLDLLLGSGDLLLEFLGLLVSRQQQPVALPWIVGQSVCVIHNAHGCNHDRPE